MVLKFAIQASEARIKLKSGLFYSSTKIKRMCLYIMEFIKKGLTGGMIGVMFESGEECVDERNRKLDC